MKITLKQLSESKFALQFIAGIDFESSNHSKEEFPNFNASRITYGIKRRLKMINPELELILEESRNIAKKHAKGKTKKVLKQINSNVNQESVWDYENFETEEAANQETKEYLKGEIEIADLKPLNYKDFGRSLPGSVLLALDYLIVAPEFEAE